MPTDPLFSDVVIGGMVRDGRADEALETRGFVPLQTPITTSWLMASAVSDAGVNVTPDTAMALAACFACIDIIARGLSTIPIDIVRKSDKSILEDHPLATLLNGEPNPEQTAVALREAMLVGCLLWGNGFLFIEKDGVDPVGLWILPSRSTSPARYPGAPNTLFYRAVTGGASYTFTADQVCHVADLSFDGIVGLSRTRYGSNALGLGLGMDKYKSKFFANGANAGGFIELPPGMKEEQINAWMASFKRNYTGLENSLKTGILTDGMKFNRTSINPRDSQMIDVTSGIVREVSRLFRVPLHKLSELGQSTFNNIEQQNREFVGDCLMPWAVKLEAEFKRKLLKENEKSKLDIKHDFKELLRGDTTTRYNAYNLALNGGWMTRNEVRDDEGLPPMEGGDVPLQPLNMGPGNGQHNNPPNGHKPPPPTPTADPAGNDDDDEDEDVRSMLRYSVDQPRGPDQASKT